MNHKPATALPGIDPETFAALRLIMALKPWQSRGVGRQVGSFLDGNKSALLSAPVLRAKVSAASKVIRKAASPRRTLT